MGIEWKALGAIGYGLPIASIVLIGMIVKGVQENLNLGVFLWLMSLFFVGLAWYLLGDESKQRGYKIFGAIAVITFAINGYVFREMRAFMENVKEASVKVLGITKTPMLWLAVTSLFLITLFTLLEIIALSHASGAFNERFLKWSAWTKATSLSLMILGFASFIPAIGDLLKNLVLEKMTLTSIFLPLVSILLGTILYVIASIFAMIGFLDLRVKVNKYTEVKVE